MTTPNNVNIYTIRLEPSVRISLEKLAEMQGIKPRTLAQRILVEYAEAALAKKIAA